MCKERWRTRDRLLDYDAHIVPPSPHSAGISTVYPWESISLQNLSHQIYILAQNNGFIGTEQMLWNKFSAGSVIMIDTINNFPEEGAENNLYLDKETDILYYFKKSSTYNYNIGDTAEVVVAGTAQAEEPNVTIYFLYIPVRALLIEDTILNCGDATE